MRVSCLGGVNPVTVVAAFLRVAFWFVDEQQALVRREKQLADVAVRRQTENGAGSIASDARDH